MTIKEVQFIEKLKDKTASMNDMPVNTPDEINEKVKAYLKLMAWFDKELNDLIINGLTDKFAEQLWGCLNE